jgi:hypothetical protein
MRSICVQHWWTELGQKFTETRNCNKQPHETVFVVDSKINDRFQVDITVAAKKLRQNSAWLANLPATLGTHFLDDPVKSRLFQCCPQSLMHLQIGHDLCH